MESRSLLLGLGAGLLLATLVLGAGSTLMPAAQSPSASQTQPAADWKAEAAKAGMVVSAQAELDQRLKQAHEEGAQQKAAELSAKPAQAQTVHVYIQPGMSTTDVAVLLQGAGVLEDGNQLIALRDKSPTSIRSGVYDLPLKGDPLQVLKAIATPPKQ
jgi:uncharacterized transporter YbjL